MRTMTREAYMKRQRVQRVKVEYSRDTSTGNLLVAVIVLAIAGVMIGAIIAGVL